MRVGERGRAGVKSILIGGVATVVVSVALFECGLPTGSLVRSSLVGATLGLLYALGYTRGGLDAAEENERRERARRSVS